MNMFWWYRCAPDRRQRSGSRRHAERLCTEVRDCEQSLIVGYEGSIQRLRGGGDNGIRELETESFSDVHRVGFH